MGQCGVVDHRESERQRLRQRMSGLRPEARAAVALAIASRVLPALESYAVSHGLDAEVAAILLDRGWDSLLGADRLDPDDLMAVWALAPPAPRDVPEPDRQEVAVASEAFLALAGALHSVVHSRPHEALSVLEDGRLAALHANGDTGVSEELAFQDQAISVAESVGMDSLTLVRQLRGLVQGDDVS